MSREPSNQELLDRYVFAIKTMLPPQDAEDIGAEIRSHIESLVEDRAMQLGRDLNLDELSEVLRLHGHPMRVAGRYRDRPAWALSPELFAFYRYTLSGMLGLIFIIMLVKAAYVFPGRSGLGSFLLETGRGFLTAGVIATGAVTLLFFAGAGLGQKFRLAQKWNPRSLAAVPRPAPAPRAPRPVVAVISGAVWLAWFAMALFCPWLFWIWGGGGHFALSPAGQAMRLPVWLIAVFALSQTWLNYTRFAASDWRRFLRLGVYLAGLALAVFVMRSGGLFIPGSNWDPSRSATSLAGVNRLIFVTAVTACIFLSLSCLHELRRYLGGGGRWSRVAAAVVFVGIATRGV